MLVNLFSLYLLDVMTKLFYGLDLDLFRHQEHPLVNHSKNLFTFFTVVPLFLTTHCPWLMKFYPDTSIEAGQYLKQLVEYAIEERKKVLEHGSKPKADFLQLFMDAPLSDIEKSANVNLLLGAGFDTTSFTLSYICYELRKNQAALKCVQKEIDTMVGDKDTVTFDDLSNLPFLENCFTEALRLHPTDVRQFRKSTSDTVIPNTDVPLPPDVTVSVPTVALQTDPELFDNPLDFYPDRWSVDRKTSIKNCSFMSFGAGPRKCPGGQLALLNVKLALVDILKRFDLEVSKKSDLTIAPGRLMSDPRHIWITFRPRS